MQSQKDDAPRAYSDIFTSALHFTHRFMAKLRARAMHAAQCGHA
jgi:hypothetical protein